MPSRRDLAALGVALAAPALAQRSPEAVPEAWRGYAATVQQRLESVVAEETGEAAGRLRQALIDRGAGGLILRLWLDADGRTERLEAGAATPALLVDLRAVLQGRVLAKAPPADLAWPISVRLVARPPAETG